MCSRNCKRVSVAGTEKQIRLENKAWSSRYGKEFGFYLSLTETIGVKLRID